MYWRKRYEVMYMQITNRTTANAWHLLCNRGKQVTHTHANYKFQMDISCNLKPNKNYCIILNGIPYNQVIIIIIYYSICNNYNMSRRHTYSSPTHTHNYNTDPSDTSIYTYVNYTCRRKIAWILPWAALNLSQWE